MSEQSSQSSIIPALACGRMLPPRYARILPFLKLSNREIAKKTGYSQGVVKQYMYQLMLLTNTKNRTALAMWFIDQGGTLV